MSDVLGFVVLYKKMLLPSPHPLPPFTYIPPPLPYLSLSLLFSPAPSHCISLSSNKACVPFSLTWYVWAAPSLYLLNVTSPSSLYLLSVHSIYFLSHFYSLILTVH